MSGLREKLVHIKHSSKLLTLLWYYSRQPFFCIKEKKFQKEAKKRKNGYQDERYIGLIQFKDRYKDKRCFIVATGPSLKISDLELIKNEYSFGMNSIPKLYGDTEWRPTYFGIQDNNVFSKMQTIIAEAYSNENNVFISSTIKDSFECPSNYYVFPYDAVYHDNQLEIEKYFSLFSDDIYSVVFDGYSITYSLIQIAIYMGFKEIYLLGVDCSYKRGAKNHVVESGNDDKNEEKNYEKMITGYRAAKEYADANGIRIVNCTCGGMLEVFPRMNLEDVLQEK